MQLEGSQKDFSNHFHWLPQEDLEKELRNYRGLQQGGVLEHVAEAEVVEL